MTFVIISLGICSIISQFVLLRELQTTFQGNELSLSLILFCWLGGSGLGGFIAKFIPIESLSSNYTEKQSSPSKAINPATIIGFALFFNSIWFLVSIFLSRSLKSFLSIPQFELLQPQQIFLISLITILPQTISIGISFVIMCSVIKNPLKAYSQEALGAFLAGLLTLALIEYLNSSQILWLISILSLVCGLSIKKKPFYLHLIFLITFIIYLLFPITGMLQKFQDYTQALRFKPEKLVASLDSIYANIAVTERDDQYNLYENGSLLFTTEDAEALEEFSHIILLNHPSPKKVLLIGSGVSGLLSEIKKHPADSITYLEPDSKLIAATLEYIPQSKSYGLMDKMVKVHNQDARLFINRTTNRYDVVILNIGNPSSLQLNRFYTVQFFQEIKNILNPDGEFSFGFSSKEDILTADMLKYNSSLYKSAKEVFNNVEIVPGERLILICSLNPKKKLNSDELIERFAERKIITKYFTPQHIKAKMMRKEYVENTLIGGEENVSINYDYSPYGFFYYLGLWGKQSWFNFKKIWDLSNRLNLTLIALFTLLLALIFNKNIVRLSMFSTGFTGIALEIIISFIFQINFGFLYYRLGVIVASFMLGLSLGGLASMQLKINQAKALFYLEMALGLTAISMCFLLKQNQTVYFLATLMVGILAGMEFGIFYSREKTTTVYALDLAGSCLGTLSIGLIFIPVLGIFTACAALALSKFTLGLFLRRQMR